MRITSKLFTKASGSIGGFTAKNSSGGLCFRSKQTSRPNLSIASKNIHQSLIRANQAWRECSEPIRQEWGDYGRSLTKTDVLGVVLHQTGLQAFISAWVLLTQAALFPQDLINHVPKSRGYLFFPTLFFFSYPNVIIFQNQSSFTIQFRSYISPQQSTSINLNRKGFKFSLNNSLPPDGYSYVPTVQALPRIFIKVKRVEHDGSFSLSHIYHHEIYNPLLSYDENNPKALMHGKEFHKTLLK